VVRQAGAAPPQVVLRAELHVGADERHLDRDEHGQHAHHEAEAEDVVEVPLPAGAARVSRARSGEAPSAAPLPCRLPQPCLCILRKKHLAAPGLVHGSQRLGWDQSQTQQSGLATLRCMTSRPATANCARAPYTRAQAQAPGQARERRAAPADRAPARARSRQRGPLCALPADRARAPARWTSSQSTAPRRWCRRAAAPPPGTARSGARPSAAAARGAGSGWCAWGKP